MESIKKDGMWSCVTTSRDEIRAQLGSIAKAKKEKQLKTAKEFLEEQGIRIHDGHKKMVDDVYNEIMDGKSNYPVHQQAELLVEADRIGIWEVQCMYRFQRNQSVVSVIPDLFLFLSSSQCATPT